METARKTNRFSVWIRVIAAVLAVAILASGIGLLQLSGVTLNSDNFEDKGSRIAARELLRDDPYASASRMEQMAAYAKNLLSGQHTMEELEQGVQISIAQAKYDDAITLTERMLEMYEGDEDGLGRLYLRLGYLCVMKNDAENALKWLNEGIDRAPSPEAYLTRAQVLLNLNDTEAALKDASVYLDTAENPDELMPDLINVYEAAGQYETAIDLYTRLIGRENGTEYLVNRAYCYTCLDRLEEAAADRDRYAEAGGKELASADVMMGISWMRRSEYGKANESFIRAIDEKYPDPESLYYYVVLCSYISQDYAQACEYGDRLISRINSGETTGTAAVEMQKNTGKLNVTLAKMDRSSLCLMTGASHVRLGSYDQAADSLTACLAADSEMAYANDLRGICFLAAERYQEAITDFDAAIAADEETERSYFSRAVCKAQIGDTAGAVEDYEWVVLNGKDESLFEEAGLQIRQLLNGTDSTEDTEISGS